MLLTTLSKATLAIFAVSLILLLTQKAEAHSYADCIDWRFKDPKNPSWSDKNGACFGYARRFPLKAKPFAKLDSDSPIAITSTYNGKDKRGRNTGAQTVSKPGGELCIRWPAKNHAVPNEKNQPVTIALSEVNPKKDPTQLQFLSNIITNLNYKNCSDRGKDTDIWPCGGCFKLPTNLKPGNVVLQWRWKLNSNEWYTSCADIKIRPSDTTSVSHTPTSASHTPTSVSHTRTSASYTPTSVSHAPTSISHTRTSASHTPTSVSHTPTSVSHTPTSVSHTPNSVSHTPTSVSHAPTSASPSVNSASHTPTSASHASTSASPSVTSAPSITSPTVGSPPITALAVFVR
ncbi:MAG: hypothetical protein JOS17DRAFT_822613 [Linnemannia elongata]|nr:MAG: hypothetical protein JOS17DRAFT_822613 [Linnemannia elongata]